MKYYTVIAKETMGDAWAAQFGDYDRNTAQDELMDMHDSGDWFKLKLITTENNQQAVDEAINKLNQP